MLANNESCGFDESTLDIIFKELYLVEVCQRARGHEVNNQHLAEQLFCTEIFCGVDQVILSIQEMFALSCSSEVDNDVLRLVNSEPQVALNRSDK
ncbi:hypothetical protein HWQ46_09815 [Shewanella sp. D64]|uniref:hypothetical protein n=1 Tax=unclassified Shewanella TaxID=196818 RepID=UPI0022BA4DC6|nr:MULTISPECIES: hypothetical protein [unclassified Shewanella]MEC4725839.1 hypothetical protein [Shewanella sp. D64]MEC4737554.1 hypothetical protein [Shewanella sp. E94]WBJ93372.1 hypothetical protein HWQ47_15670 [Shewanella sp. MTB7]